jgi:Ca2+-binding RTX toxin-like protein
VYGRGGNDFLRADTGDDIIDGGVGSDLIGYSGEATSGVTVNLTNGSSVGGGLGTDRVVSVEDLSGSHYKDDISATAGPNWIEGRGGSDIIRGGDGRDEIWDDYVGCTFFDAAPTGRDDTVYGGRGDDRLEGCGGEQTIYAGPGDDYVNGSSFTSDVDPGAIVYGGEGNDTLFGGNLYAEVYGQAGNDFVSTADPGQGDSDLADGGAGTDDCVADATDRVRNCP